MRRLRPLGPRVRTWLVAGTLLGGVAWGEDVNRVSSSTESPKTVITSRSARVIEKGRSVEFTGHVVLVRGSDYLTADRLVTEDDNAVARAWGSVYFKRESASESVRWEAWGDRAIYDTRVASGTLWGDGRVARARRTPVGSAVLRGGVVDVEAPEITLVRGSTRPDALDVADGKAVADGGVYLRSVESGPVGRVTELWSRHVDYDGAGDHFVLEGAYPATLWGDRPLPPPEGIDRPYARQAEGRERRELRGERMDLRPALRSLTVHRAVRADLLFEVR